MSSIETVLPYLKKLFDTQRLVFWHDADGYYASELDSVGLSDVAVLHIDNNEFGIKRQILRKCPEQRFLIYRQGEVPADRDNLLLDLELAYGIFTADRSALLRQELGLTNNDTMITIAEHEEFFQAKDRMRRLKDLVDPADSPEQLQAKMCAALFKQKEYSLMELTRTLLIENAQGSNEKYALLEKYGLANFHWVGAKKIYGYDSTQPSIDDFILWLFRKAATDFRDGTTRLRNAELDFMSFRNDRRSSKAMHVLAKRAETDLNIAERTADADLSELVSCDLYDAVEKKIVQTMAYRVAERTITPREVADIVQARKTGFWFDEYKENYTAISAASQLLALIAAGDFTADSFDTALAKYQDTWFKIDQLYRQFHRSARVASVGGAITGLRDEVDNYYVNRYLFELGMQWQKHVDSADRWQSKELSFQKDFYEKYVRALTKNGAKKAVIIISDALRYEIAEELGSRIRQEDGYTAELTAMLGVLPSYTQLGMAALLPNHELSYSTDAKTVLVDDQRSDGTINRAKILNTVNGTAIQAEDVFRMKTGELRELHKQHQFIYVYHNRIDKAGDDKVSEHTVFEETEATIDELAMLVTKLTSGNATNFFVTADHGFLYQYKPLDDSGFLSNDPHGDNLLVKNRRFVIGHGLKEDDSFKKLTASQIGVQGDLEFLIPKSIHRLRRKGSGELYVHGGASLQEIVVPVLAINKKRASDTREVEVKILPETNKITTGQVVVQLLQAEAVTDKIKPRTLRAAIYAGDVLISSRQELLFDQTSPDVRDRYQSANILLTQDADQFNAATVQFRLEERIPHTTQWRLYASAPYTLQRSFTMDFDF
ncbi:BREX-1 system phosphatase PglZ type A [Actinotignum sp. GS-2025a]|uniref:BREX-1 system phosphatase PglZ type A n=1 Tax=Actinotignum TaxID=1653174 RepID=UPI00254F42BF|nr:BREX-1 system phosphatase PglZ type A [Actinotignum timonense]MDK6927467.1 BREX-1 system phosphatase PglZ type A [Actinotignum timonense]